MEAIEIFNIIQSKYKHNILRSELIEQFNTIQADIIFQNGRKVHIWRAKGDRLNESVITFWEVDGNTILYRTTVANFDMNEFDSIISGESFSIDDIVASNGHSWKSYAEKLGQNPSNFKRQLVKKIDQLNHWLSPLNLQIQIAPKGESGNKKEKKKIRTTEASV